MILLLFFFFQAEDGIRDLYVTGVQTCALPISIADLRIRHGRVASPVDPASRVPRTVAAATVGGSAQSKRPRQGGAGGVEGHAGRQRRPCGPLLGPLGWIHADAADWRSTRHALTYVFRGAALLEEQRQTRRWTGDHLLR